MRKCVGVASTTTTDRQGGREGRERGREVGREGGRERRGQGKRGAERQGSKEVVGVMFPPSFQV